MTREEDLDWLYRLRSKIYVYMPKEWLIPMNNALDTAIQAIKQDLVIDKIRAEIESCKEDLEPHLCDNRYYRNEALDMALDILDKYKAESEEV